MLWWYDKSHGKEIKLNNKIKIKKNNIKNNTFFNYYFQYYARVPPQDIHRPLHTWQPRVLNEGDGFILKVLSPRTEYRGQRAIENYTCIPLYYYLTKHFIINYSSAQVVEHSFRLNCTFEDMLQFLRKSSCSNYIFIDILENIM